MKVIGNKSNKTSLKNTSEQNHKAEDGHSADNMDILGITMTDRADIMSARNGSAVSGCVFNVRD